MGRARAWLVVLALALCVGACKSDEKTGGAPSAAQAKPAVPAPKGLMAEAVVPKPAELLADMRKAVGGPMMLLPKTVGGAVVNVLGLPITAAEMFDENLPVVAAVASVNGAPAMAGAVHVKDGERLVSRLTGGADATFTARAEGDFTWLSAKPNTLKRPLQKATLAVVDHYLVVATSEAAVRGLGPYLARTAGPRKPPDKQLAIDITADAFGGDIGKRAARLRELTAALPVPKSIAPLIDVGGGLDALIALLADLGAGSAELALTERALALKMELKARDGEAAKRLSARGALELSELLKLPDDTVAAIAWSETASGRKQRAELRAKRVVKQLGEGVDPDAAKSVSTSIAALATGRGDRTFMGLRAAGSVAPASTASVVSMSPTGCEGLVVTVAGLSGAAAAATAAAWRACVEREATRSSTTFPGCISLSDQGLGTGLRGTCLALGHACAPDGPSCIVLVEGAGTASAGGGAGGAGTAAADGCSTGGAGGGGAARVGSCCVRAAPPPTSLRMIVGAWGRGGTFRPGSGGAWAACRAFREKGTARAALGGTAMELDSGVSEDSSRVTAKEERLAGEAGRCRLASRGWLAWPCGDKGSIGGGGGSTCLLVCCCCCCGGGGGGGGGGCCCCCCSSCGGCCCCRSCAACGWWLVGEGGFWGVEEGKILGMEELLGAPGLAAARETRNFVWRTRLLGATFQRLGRGVWRNWSDWRGRSCNKNLSLQASRSGGMTAKALSMMSTWTDWRAGSRAALGRTQ